MPVFDYVAPATLPEASHLLQSATGEGAVRILAGGTDLLVRMRRQQLFPRLLVDIKKLSDLQGLNENPEADFLNIGATTTIRSLELYLRDRREYAALFQAANSLGSVQVRNRATIGGNLSNAAPSADMAPALLALGARVRLQGPQGERLMLLGDFFSGPGATVLQKGELLIEVQVPRPPRQAGGSYLKHTIRRAMDIALVGVAAFISVDASGKISAARLALGAAAPTPLLIIQPVEELLVGEQFDPRLLAKVGQAASRHCQPISDLRCSAAYRREMVRVLAERSLVRAYHQALEGKE